MSNTATLSPITVTLAVEGMNCQSCVRHVDEALKQHVTLIKHAIDLAGKRLTVSFDPATTSLAAIAQVLDQEGYATRVL